MYVLPRSIDSWLFFLGFCAKSIPLSPSLTFWRSFADLFIRKLKLTPELEELRADAVVPLVDEDHTHMLGSAPPMPGGEYLTVKMLSTLWEGLHETFYRKIEASPGSVADFFSQYSPDVHLAGRIYFHLAENRDLSGWLRFFLFGVRETAQRSIEVFRAILAMKERIEREVIPLFHVRRQQNAQLLMRTLYQLPVVNIKQVRDLLGVHTNTASALVNDFVGYGLLRELTGHKRNRLFIFEKYVQRSVIKEKLLLSPVPRLQLTSSTVINRAPARKTTSSSISQKKTPPDLGGAFSVSQR